MTEALRAELAAARQEIVRKDRLFAMLAHDLRAPLSTLLLWETVLHGDPDPRNRARAIEAIHRSAKAQSALLAHLVDFVRALDGTLRIPLRPVDVGALLEVAVERCHAQVTALKLSLERRIAARLGSVSADPERLHQVVACMLSNVFARAAADHEVVLSAETMKDTITIEASTSRPGSTLVVSTQDEHRVGGIELALVRELTTLIGGALDVTRTRDSDGFGFRLTLHRIRKIPDSTRSIDGTMKKHAQPDRRARAGVGGRRRRRRTDNTARPVREGDTRARAAVQGGPGDGS